jgi:hypothetical protein
MPDQLIRLRCETTQENIVIYDSLDLMARIRASAKFWPSPVLFKKGDGLWIMVYFDSHGHMRGQEEMVWVATAVPPGDPGINGPLLELPAGEAADPVELGLVIPNEFLDQLRERPRPRSIVIQTPDRLFVAFVAYRDGQLTMKSLIHTDVVETLP